MPTDAHLEGLIDLCTILFQQLASRDFDEPTALDAFEIRPEAYEAMQTVAPSLPAANGRPVFIRRLRQFTPPQTLDIFFDASSTPLCDMFQTPDASAPADDFLRNVQARLTEAGADFFTHGDRRPITWRALAELFENVRPPEGWAYHFMAWTDEARAFLSGRMKPRATTAAKQNDLVTVARIRKAIESELMNGTPAPAQTTVKGWLHKAGFFPVEKAEGKGRPADLYPVNEAIKAVADQVCMFIKKANPRRRITPAQAAKKLTAHLKPENMANP